MCWTREDASHLISRSAFDGSVELVENLFRLGRRGAIHALLDLDNEMLAGVRDGVDVRALPGNHALLHAMLTWAQPLRARLAWFWLEHFAPALRLASMATPIAQLRTLSANAAGCYREFLPAMYQQGLIAGNLASLRVEPAVMTVTASAPADTLARARPVARVAARDTLHRLFDRADTMQAVCGKLYRTFVHAHPDEAERAHLVQVWQRSGGQIAQVLRVLMEAGAFWDRSLRGKQPKSEVRFALGLVRRLGLPVSATVLEQLDEHLAQTCAHWPAAGEDANIGDVMTGPGAAALVRRYQFARYAVFAVDARGVVERLTHGLPRRLAPQAFVTLLSQRLGIAALGACTRAAVSEYLGHQVVTPGDDQERLLGAIYLLTCSAEYQHC